MCTCTFVYSYSVPSLPIYHRSNNPAILQLLLSLTGMIYDSDVQCLIITSIATCPDMLTPYLQSTSLSFEPRAHSKWVHNVDFLTSVSSVTLPYPYCLPK